MTPCRLACRAVVLLGLIGLAGCGVIQPGTPGHEPPSAGRYNPVSHELNESSR